MLKIFGILSPIVIASLGGLYFIKQGEYEAAMFAILGGTSTTFVLSPAPEELVSAYNRTIDYLVRKYNQHFGIDIPKHSGWEVTEGIRKVLEGTEALAVKLQIEEPSSLSSSTERHAKLRNEADLSVIASYDDLKEKADLAVQEAIAEIVDAGQEASEAIAVLHEQAKAEIESMHLAAQARIDTLPQIARSALAT